MSRFDRYILSQLLALFGFFSLVMSHRMREAPGSRWVGLMHWLTSIASAFSFVVGIGLALAFLVHVFE